MTNLYQRTQKVSVNKWETLYGNSEVVQVAKAEGDYLIDMQGKKYIDWNNGILCKVFGYGDKKMEQIVAEQMKTGVIHTSSVYLNEPAVKFKEEAVKMFQPFGDFVVLPASSGTIADSMALRVALANVRVKNPKAKVLYIIPGFGYSGADFGANARCGLEDWRGLSTHFMEDVKFIPPEIMDVYPFDEKLAIKASQVEQWFVDNVDSENAIPVVLSEAGELGLGGFRQITSDWMRAVTLASKKRNGIFICDCVQAFPLRTGNGLWGFERWVKSSSDSALPDIITTAKGLGDGAPIALVAMKRELAEKLDGKWFDTFAASPLAACVAIEVIRRVQDPKVINNVQTNSKILAKGLSSICKEFPQIVRGVIGSGLMSGLAVQPKKLLSIRDAAQKGGLLFAMGTDGTIRIAPHLDSSAEIIEKGVKILRDAISQCTA